MTTDARVFYNISRNDSIQMGRGAIREASSKLKDEEIVFWLYNKGMANPTECYFELHNDKGTKEMAIDDFIKNSKLTFYHRGTLIL